MAKFVICAVRDAAVGAFNTPMFFRTVDEARRSFGDAVADPKSGLGGHAKDYSMWLLGEWDDKGEISTCAPDCLMQAIDALPLS